MSKIFIEDTSLTNIADAIRAKTGDTSKLSPAQMVTAIDSISGGGLEYKSYKVNFAGKSANYITAPSDFTDNSKILLYLTKGYFQQSPYRVVTMGGLLVKEFVKLDGTLTVYPRIIGRGYLTEKAFNNDWVSQSVYRDSKTQYTQDNGLYYTDGNLYSWDGNGTNIGIFDYLYMVYMP